MQKKTLPAILIASLFAYHAGAQIKKGATLLGGQIGFSTSKTTYDQGIPSQRTSNAANFSPAFGKAIKENLVIGGDITFGYNNIKSAQSQTVNSYGLGFFVREYRPLGKNFYAFLQERVGGYYNRTTIDNQNSPSQLLKGYGAQIGFYPGIAYSVTSTFQIEAGFNNLAYLQFDHSSTLGSSSNSFALGTSLSSSNAGITLGFRFLLN